MLSGKRIGLKERLVVKEAMNCTSVKGILSLVKSVIIMTFTIELIGMLLSFTVFIQDYDFPTALGISAFHSIAAFNNSGFDVLGGLRNLIPYQNNVLLNLTTCGLIILGGMGFFVISDVLNLRKGKRLCLHSKLVLSVTAVLLIIGTLLLKATEDISWLGAFFFSTSARTAGFSTYPLGEFSKSGLFTLIILMFIGASPGSTGGGIKTTTFYIVLRSLLKSNTDNSCNAFKRKIPKELIVKCYIILILSLFTVVVTVFLLCLAEKSKDFLSLLFESVSAFGTVGLSVGITPDLTDFSKIVLVLTMFAGRLGPLTIASFWNTKSNPDIEFAEEAPSVG